MFLNPKITYHSVCYTPTYPELLLEAQKRSLLTNYYRSSFQKMQLEGGGSREKGWGKAELTTLYET